MKDRPTLKSGKICYVEIPATNLEHSAEFYQRVFGWRIRHRKDGTIGFDDTVNEVSGSFLPHREPSRPSVMVHIMVADAASAAKEINDAGGEIVRPLDPNTAEVFAHFRDPGGNVLGIYQQPGLAVSEADETPGR